MKRWILFAMLAIGGCQSAAEEPNQSTVLAGDYQAVANCFYQKVATTPGYRKVDMPSTNTSTIEGGRDGGSQDKIAFTATGDGITKVQTQLDTPGSAEAWSRYLIILRQCEEPGASS
jgi:hypothetical protein